MPHHSQCLAVSILVCLYQNTHTGVTSNTLMQWFTLGETKLVHHHNNTQHSFDLLWLHPWSTHEFMVAHKLYTCMNWKPIAKVMCMHNFICIWECKKHTHVSHSHTQHTHTKTLAFSWQRLKYSLKSWLNLPSQINPRLKFNRPYVFSIQFNSKFISFSTEGIKDIMLT